MANKTRPVWRLKVVSSNIEKAAYHVIERKLSITFKSGTKYIYEDVSVREFMDFTLAKSQGAYLNERIKPKKEFVEVTK